MVSGELVGGNGGFFDFAADTNCAPVRLAGLGCADKSLTTARIGVECLVA
jgi:hypothetical protein